VKVRSVTVGWPVEWPLQEEAVRAAGAVAARVATALESAGIEVETRRLALPPLVDVVGWEHPERALPFAQVLDALCPRHGLDYVSVGPVRGAVAPRAAMVERFADAASRCIAETGTVFATVAVAEGGTVSSRAVGAAARAVVEIARATDQGFGNFRFAAIAQCPPMVPFFPAAYHDGGSPQFALALEAADVVVAAARGAGSVEQVEDDIVGALERAVRPVEETAVRLQEDTGVRYAGCDLSPAPFPSPGLSIAEALEALGVDAFGGPGTLAAARVLTRALRRVRVRTCGFSGLMLPVMEDAVLARRASEGRFGLRDLLLFSAVCGTGIDTVPLPGDVEVDEVAAILLEVATLATALDKPLTARLLPVPGRRAGEVTTYDFPYFANTTVFATSGLGARRLLERGLT